MQKQAYSRGTLKNLLCQWRSFSCFCKKFGIFKWPINEHVLSLYAQYLGYTFHSPKAVRNYLSGIRTLHILTKEVPPSLKEPEICLTLRGLERTMNHTVKKAQPLTPEILINIFTFLDMRKYSDLVFWGILLIGFFGMLRKSNLFPDSTRSFDPKKQLTGLHMSFQQGTAILTLTWAKNIQCNERNLEIPLFEIPNSELCPVKILKILVDKQGVNKHPLFGKGKSISFTYTCFHKKFRQVLIKAGYNGVAFSSHSMRRGGYLCSSEWSTRITNTGTRGMEKRCF